jgi:hypothetical protein
MWDRGKELQTPRVHALHQTFENGIGFGSEKRHLFDLSLIESINVVRYSTEMPCKIRY